MHDSTDRRTGGLRARSARAILLASLLVVSFAPLANAEEVPQRDILISTHDRFSFEKDVVRFAVADPTIVEFELLSEREGLALGKSLGRTSVMVWFDDGSVETFLLNVRRDLSLLEEALAEIHPSIRVSSAPDRDAVVLRGTVPDVSYSNVAEEMAQRYLDARRGRRTNQGAPGVRAGDGELPAPLVESNVEVTPNSAVINLIQVDMLPQRLEDRMQDAIQNMGLTTVTVRRLVRGRVPNDEDDIFVLEGSLETQTELVRVLSVAQSLLGAKGSDELKVRADESGGLAGEADRARGIRPPRVGGLSQLFGSSTSSTSLRNLIDANIGRAKVIEAADGRLLSFIKVKDLPQVRVHIQLYEVNSSKLRAFNSEFGVIASNFDQRSLNPAASAVDLQGPAAARVGAAGENPDVQNVLGFLAGTLSNQFQLSGDNFVLDSLLSLLEERGFARSLSRPSLTVLSGERAFFQVGGEIPVPTSFASNIDVAAGGVFNSVVFRPFGVQLSIRPLVGDGGEVTLDIAPQISLPDAQLTATVRASTGTEQLTTSFRTRYLQTTAKLKDGQALMVGGLITRNMSSSDSGTPGLSDTPVVGGLFSGYERQGDEFQLVVVVHPVVVREPSNMARMWAFPAMRELMSPCGTCRVRPR